MLTRWFIGLGVFFCCGVAFLATVVRSSRFTMPHPRARNVKVLLTDHGAVVELPKLAEGAPKVRVKETKFDFGRMDPSTSGKHAFPIRNIGTAPLTLEVTSATCKCTVGGVSDNVVPPGKDALVTLDWNTGNKSQNFAQSAEVRTNDPLRPTVNLQVEGKVRMLFGSESEELVAPLITPGKPMIVETIVYSQIWDNLEIQEAKGSIPGLKIEFQPIPADQVQRLEAKSGRLMRVTIPGDLPQGGFHDVIHINATRPNAPKETASCEMRLAGTTRRRFTIHGNFSEDDTLLIGQVLHGEKRKIRLLLKIRDEDLTFPIRSIETKPSYLKVSVERHRNDGDLAASGLYDLIVEVPDDAPIGQYMGNPLGSLRITTEHPRIPEISLKVRMAVVP